MEPKTLQEINEYLLANQPTIDELSIDELKAYADKHFAVYQYCREKLKAAGQSVTIKIDRDADGDIIGRRTISKRKTSGTKRIYASKTDKAREQAIDTLMTLLHCSRTDAVKQVDGLTK